MCSGCRGERLFISGPFTKAEGVGTIGWGWPALAGGAAEIARAGKRAGDPCLQGVGGSESPG